VPGGAGGTSVGTPIWASIAVLANARRIANGAGYIGNRFNYAIWDLGRNAQDEVFNDIISDLGTPISGRPGTFPNGGSGRIYNDPMSDFGSPFPPTDPGVDLFENRWPFGWINPSFIGYDLATGWGTPKVMPLLDRLGQHFLEPISNLSFKWEGEFREAINKTGPLSTPAAGFVNGVGTLSTGSSLDPSVLTFSFTPTQQYTITVTNFQVFPVARKPDNRFSGFGAADVTILLTSSSPSNAAPTTPTTPPGGGGTGGGTDPNAPPPTPTQLGSQVESSPPLGGNELRTWLFGNLSFVGKIYRSKSGRQHITGSFHSLDPTGKPEEGLTRPVFRGKFSG
jgi:hypothetical protein